MIAAEFGQPGGHPDPAAAKAVQKACIERGLLLLTCGPYDNIIRWIPPLVVTQDQIDEALEVFEHGLEAGHR